MANDETTQKNIHRPKSQPKINKGIIHTNWKIKIDEIFTLGLKPLYISLSGLKVCLHLAY